MGVFGGVAGQSGGCSALVGNTSVKVANGGETSFIAGGNRMAANLTGNILLSVENGGTVGGILGRNYVHDSVSSVSTIDGNISIDVSGNVKVKSSWLSNNVINGIIGGGANTNVTGTTSITINNTASITGGIVGGARDTRKAFASKTARSPLTAERLMFPVLKNTLVFLK